MGWQADGQPSIRLAKKQPLEVSQKFSLCHRVLRPIFATKLPADMRSDNFVAKLRICAVDWPEAL
jgi:hypothetical protein